MPRVRPVLLNCLFASLAALAPPLLLAGDGGDYGPLPPIGSSNVSIADPLVSRPATTPCEVVLLDTLTFNDFTPRQFTVDPPAACAGPWSRVVLSVDLDVSAGRQFDRTATIWIGGVNVYFGTTAEPSAALAPSWHVERDLTDYSALLTTPQVGDVFIGNVVDDTYTGIIHGSAKLQFYPLADGDSAPATPDQVIALGAAAPGSTVDLATPTSTLSRTLTLPTNIERAYVDVFAQAQAGDEFWWTCQPDAVAPITNDCPGTAFREIELTIDGTPAGIAPIYPWVYTGGFQPLLWIPIPGMQTLNFKPYRVDLTPFAGTLSDGAEHTIALSVFNAHDHFSTTAALLLHLDSGSTQVSGAITANTIGAGPTPMVDSSIGSDGLGTTTVTSDRTVHLAGYVTTSHGRVDTSIDQMFSFNATTAYAAASPTVTDWTISHHTRVDTTTTVSSGGIVGPRTTTEHLSYPFDMLLPFNSSSGAIVTADFSLGYQRLITDGGGARQSTSNVVATHYAPALASRHSSQDYEHAESTGACYHRTITAISNHLATVVDHQPCALLDVIFDDGFDGGT